MWVRTRYEPDYTTGLGSTTDGSDLREVAPSIPQGQKCLRRGRRRHGAATRLVASGSVRNPKFANSVNPKPGIGVKLTGMKRLALLGLCVLALAAVGCTGGGSSAAPSAAANVLRYPIPTSPTSIDPGVVQDGDTLDMIQQVFEGLVTWGTDNTVVPLLAEKWDVEEGGKVYVFHIKKGVKFHNGREVTADDFKWTWERNCDPELKSQTAGAYMIDIVGVKDVVEGKAKEISGVKVVDPYTLRVEIDKPRPYFLGKMTYLVTAPMPKEIVGGPKEFNTADKAVGTGPFTMKQFVPKQLAVLERNENYHGPKATLVRIERPVVLDPATRLNMYKLGQVDMCLLQREDVEGIEKDAALKGDLHYFPRPAIWYVGLNCGEKYPPFKDRRVRQAFAMAINRDRIVDEILRGVNQKALSIVPPGVFGYREKATFLPYDPAKAKALLAEAGFPDGKGLPPLELRHRTGYRDISVVAQAVQQDLKDNLGVTLNIREMEWRSYLEAYNKGENLIFHMRWAADYLDAQNFLSHMLATDGPENHLSYSNPEFDKLCHEADSTMDSAKRLELYAKAEDMVLQDAPWVPIYFQRDAELIRPSVKGLRESLFGHLPHTTTSVEPEAPKK